MSDIMRQAKVQKVVVNIGVGDAGERLVKAQKVLEMLTKHKPKITNAKVTNRDLGVREGMPIGCKVTLRGDEAEKFLNRALGYVITLGLALALGAGKPVICCWRQGRPVSKMITGNSNPSLKLAAYAEVEELIEQVRNFLAEALAR